MSTKKSNKSITRNGVVDRWSAWAGLSTIDADPVTGIRKSMSTITLYGTFDAPVKGTTQFEIMFKEGTPEIGNIGTPSIGAFIKAKPTLNGYLALHASEFQMMLTLATSGHLRFLYCAFEEPRYGFARIINMNYGSDPDEDA